MLRLLEGFEISSIESELMDKYSVYDGSTNSRETGRLAGYSQDPTELKTFSLTEQNGWVIGFGLRLEAHSSVIKFLDIYRGANRQCSLVFERAGSNPDYYTLIKLYKDRTSDPAIATSVTQLQSATWYYIELKVEPKSSGSYELRINEISEFSGSGENLANSGSDGADIFHFYGSNGWLWKLDDLYILDTITTTTNNPYNDFFGDSQIIGIAVEADGSSIEWTPSIGDNYACIDDAWNLYSTADYIESNTDQHLDLFQMADVAEVDLPGDIKAVQLSAFCALSAVGSRKFKFAHHDTTTTVVQVIDDEKTVSGAGASAAKAETTILGKNPEDDSDWNLTDLNNSEFGAKIIPT